eukprot:gnl/TRDRNA2_/TRDRNA2_83345_c0_seq1.p1 gnl/TRDRNA2_/TRDRNA2_83345_c0~~gnl/TRDRNA2_/TRDRNA2_83345_c0_seq1.p1  ORF type:complete len:439 (-),score=117.97 gnl/TRDRNA2_/TRDRNA2_83345_c0_seq1:77-1267(-)
MHHEVVKHKMTKKGWGSENQVWETSNAMCLGLMQKYRLDPAKETLEAKGTEDDDEAFMQQSGIDTQNFMRGMLVLKMGCQRWLEDYGGDTSGFIFKSVRDGSNTAEGTAKDFCIRHANQCGASKKKREAKMKEEKAARREKRMQLAKDEEEKEAKIKKDDPFSNLPEDSKYGLQRMLELARDDPFHYMEESAKNKVLKGQKDLRCDVCRVALGDAYERVSKLPKSMRHEDDMLPIVESVCTGGKDLSVPNYFGVEPPPLPPVWTDRYRPHIDKDTGLYKLKKFPKKAAKKRKQWREASATGKQKPPGGEESEADMMMVHACKDIMEPEKMTEVLYKQMKVCTAAGAGTACEPVLATARAICRAADGSVCNYDAASGAGATDRGSESSTAAESKKEL